MQVYGIAAKSDLGGRRRGYAPLLQCIHTKHPKLKYITM